MSTGALIGIIIAIVAVVAIAVVTAQELRRARLRRQFGPEYTRLAKQLGSNRKAEAELAARQRRASKLNIRPLTAAQQTRYTSDWTAVQEQFVDAPAEAVRGASRLVETVLRERGYPSQDHDEIIDVLSVHHSRRLGEYRHGREIRGRSDSASTEELREAILSYRALFRELVGAGKASTAQSPLTRLAVLRRKLMQPEPARPAAAIARVPQDSTARVSQDSSSRVPRDSTTRVPQER
jgi:hypothetical protein